MEVAHALGQRYAKFIWFIMLIYSKEYGRKRPSPSPSTGSLLDRLEGA